MGVGGPWVIGAMVVGLGRASSYDDFGEVVVLVLQFGREMTVRQSFPRKKREEEEIYTSPIV